MALFCAKYYSIASKGFSFSFFLSEVLCYYKHFEPDEHRLIKIYYLFLVFNENSAVNFSKC